MRLFPLGLAGLLLLAGLSAPALAGITYSSPQGATNQLGQAVSAKAEFTLTRELITVRLTNTTPNPTSFQQTLAGFTFSIHKKKKAEGDLVWAKGIPGSLAGDTVALGVKPREVPWTLTCVGGKYQLRAPGNHYTILPKAKEYTGADASLTDTPNHNPYLVGTGVFEIHIPDLELTEDLIEIRFLWGDELGLVDPEVTAPTSERSLLPSDMPVGQGSEASLTPSPTGSNDFLSHGGAYGSILTAPGALPHTVTAGPGVSGGGGGSGGEREYSALLPTDPTFSDNPEDSPPLITIPEPASVGMLLGLLAVGWAVRRGRK